MKLKRLSALLISTLLVVSLAGCGGNDKQSSEGSENTASRTDDNAEESSEVQMPALDTDPEAKKTIEEKIDISKLGELSRFAVQMFENKTLKVKFDVEQISDDSESSSDSGSSVDLSTLSDEITVGITRNADNDYRLKLDLGLFSLDILNNKDGVYSVNRKTRSYFVITDKSKESSAENSESSKEKAEKAVDKINDVTGGALEGLDIDSMLNDPPKTEWTFNGSSKESYKNEDYQCESYTVKSDKSLIMDTSSDSSKDKDKKDADKDKDKGATAQVKVYFGDDNMMKLIHIEGETKKYDLIIKELTLEIDESELSIPAEYELNEESSMIDLSALGL